MKHHALPELADYGVFDHDVLDQAHEAAEYAASFDTHDEFLEKLGAEILTVTYEGYRPSEVVRIPARGSDRRGVIPVGLAMANPIDGGQKFQLGAIAAAAPEYDVVAFGNPSGGTYKSGVLSRRHAKQVASGDLSPMTVPIVSHLEQASYDQAFAVGYSFGADLSAEIAAELDMKVTGHVGIDAATAKPEHIAIKGLKFARTGDSFSGYVADSEMPAFHTARADSLKAFDFNTGVLKLSNLAIANYIAKGQYATTIANMLDAHQDAVHSGFWAEKSEFGNGELMPNIYAELIAAFDERAIGYTMKDQTHAFGNHIPTLQAMVLQGLKNAQ